MPQRERATPVREGQVHIYIQHSSSGLDFRVPDPQIADAQSRYHKLETGTEASGTIVGV